MMLLVTSLTSPIERLNQVEAGVNSWTFLPHIPPNSSQFKNLRQVKAEVNSFTFLQPISHRVSSIIVLPKDGSFENLRSKGLKESSKRQTEAREKHHNAQCKGYLQQNAVLQFYNLLGGGHARFHLGLHHSESKMAER